MRIAICGTHGTGKTTLARALSERLGVPMIEEVARKVIKRAGFQSTKEYIEKATKDQIESIQRNIFSKQKMAENMLGSDFVSDRSVFDALAYTKVYGVAGKYVLHEMIGEAVEHALNTYDLIVYIRPIWDPEDDGFREATDKNLWLEVDRLLNRYIHAFCLFGGARITLDCVDLDKRVETVIRYVERANQQAVEMP